MSFGAPLAPECCPDSRFTAMNRLKLIAAVLLLGSVALPQSTCAGYRAPDGRFVIEVPRNAAPGSYQPTVERHYAFDDVHLDDPASWLWPLVFLWPLPLLGLAARKHGPRVLRVLMVLEPLLVLASGFLIWTRASLFDTPAAGAYVALGALALYLGAYVVDLRNTIRARHAGVMAAQAPL